MKEIKELQFCGKGVLRDFFNMQKKPSMFLEKEEVKKDSEERREVYGANL